MTESEQAFEFQTVDVPIEQIVPTRMLTADNRKSTRYWTIRASILEVGLIEPLVVCPEGRRERPHNYHLLDGHLRLDILKRLAQSTATCLIATENETFTYNKYVCRLSPIQEHLMIVRAIERGVPAERVARALNVNVGSIREKQNLLNGIAPEVVELLKDRMVNALVFRILRNMMPMRQLEAAELMCAANRFTYAYARALLAATKPDQLVDPERGKRIKGVSAEDIARMEREMDGLTRDYKRIEDGFGTTVLNLVVARGYVTRLLGNTQIQRYLDRHHPEILSELKAVVEATAADTPSPALD